MPRYLVIAVLLSVAAVAAVIPFLWAESEAYLTVGRGLHPFLAGGLTAGLAFAALYLAALLLSDPRR